LQGLQDRLGRLGLDGFECPLGPLAGGHVKFEGLVDIDQAIDLDGVEDAVDRGEALVMERVLDVVRQQRAVGGAEELVTPERSEPQ
jgi:hypothetical protein